MCELHFCVVGRWVGRFRQTGLGGWMGLFLVRFVDFFLRGSVGVDVS